MGMKGGIAGALALVATASLSALNWPTGSLPAEIRADSLVVRKRERQLVMYVRNGLGWLGRAHRLLDWTSGCIALTNSEIEQLWTAVPDGTPIRIVP
jgi:hypothetical protein